MSIKKLTPLEHFTKPSTALLLSAKPTPILQTKIPTKKVDLPLTKEALEAKFQKGVSLNREKKYSQAIREFLPVYNLSTTTESQYKFTAAYHVGLNFSAIQEYDQALPYLQHAYQYAKETKNQLLLANSSLEMGTCFRGKKDNVHAKEYLEQAKNILANEIKPTPKSLLLRAKLHLAHCYYDEKKYALTKAYCNDTILLLKDAPNKAKLADISLLLGACIVMQEPTLDNSTYLQAKETLEKARTLFTELGNESERAKSNQFLGSCHLRMGFHATAITYLTEAHTYFHRMGILKDENAVNLALSLCYSATGSAYDAKQTLSKAVQFSETLSPSSKHSAMELFTYFKSTNTDETQSSSQTDTKNDSKKNSNIVAACKI